MIETLTEMELLRKIKAGAEAANELRYREPPWERLSRSFPKTRDLLGYTLLDRHMEITRFHDRLNNRRVETLSLTDMTTRLANLLELRGMYTMLNEVVDRISAAPEETESWLGSRDAETCPSFEELTERFGLKPPSEEETEAERRALLAHHELLNRAFAKEKELKEAHCFRSREGDLSEEEAEEAARKLERELSEIEWPERLPDL
ncbi:MAG: hypothetical protein LBF41_00950 [Deltaproteobacteria bacterium]|nr:hypothetical protein [Deltaproteobacteria bacterium]